MTHAEKRMLVDAARLLGEMRERMDVQESRVEALCDLVSILVNRKAGRPAASEVARIEELQARTHGTHH